MTREDYLKLLREDPNFRLVMDKSKDDKEKQLVTAMSEKFLMAFFDVIEPIREAAEKDPEAFKKQLLEVEKELLTTVTGSRI